MHFHLCMEGRRKVQPLWRENKITVKIDHLEFKQTQEI